jgi:hypothetical protein
MKSSMAVVVLSIALSATAFAKGGTAGPGNMMHCPAAVPNAKTDVKDIKDGVELTITADGEAAATEIQRRAKHLVEAAKVDPNTVRHTGDGHGGGGLGMCVVVLKDTLVTSEDVKNGARITVRPIKSIDLEWLRKEVATRRAAMNAKGK